MNQAGLYKATLYENKSIVIDYTLFTIATSGDTVTLDNRPKLRIDPQNVIINYELSAQKNDLTQNEINTLNNSVYGWIAKLEYQDGRIRLIEKPFFNFTANQINTNQTHSREITLKAWNKQGLIPFN